MDSIPRVDQPGVMARVLSASDSAFGPDTVPEKTSKASFYYRFYLARALVHAGLGDHYVDTLAPWRTMLAEGLTTWAETPEPTRSDSHAWSAHPTYDLLTSVAGVGPGSPGFASVLLQPQLGRLRTVKADVPTPKGVIHVDYEVSVRGVRALIDLPAGLAGQLLWNGAPHVLKPGHLELNLPPAASMDDRFR